MLFVGRRCCCCCCFWCFLLRLSVTISLAILAHIIYHPGVDASQRCWCCGTRNFVSMSGGVVREKREREKSASVLRDVRSAHCGRRKEAPLVPPECVLVKRPQRRQPESVYLGMTNGFARSSHHDFNMLRCCCCCCQQHRQSLWVVFRRWWCWYFPKWVALQCRPVQYMFICICGHSHVSHTRLRWCVLCVLWFLWKVTQNKILYFADGIKCSHRLLLLLLLLMLPIMNYVSNIRRLHCHHPTIRVHHIGRIFCLECLFVEGSSYWIWL